MRAYEMKSISNWTEPNWMCALKVRIEKSANRYNTTQHSTVQSSCRIDCSPVSVNVLHKHTIMKRCTVFALVGSSYVKLFKFDHSKLCSEKNGHFFWSLHPFIMLFQWKIPYTHTHTLSMRTRNAEQRKKWSTTHRENYVDRRRNSFSCNENMITDTQKHQCKTGKTTNNRKRVVKWIYDKVKWKWKSLAEERRKRNSINRSLVTYKQLLINVEQTVSFVAYYLLLHFSSIISMCRIQF